MRKKAWAAVGVLVCALALAACGGSDSSSSSSSSDITAYCDKVHELNQLQSPFASVKPGDVQGAKDALDTVNSKIAGIADVAPDAVRSDVDQLQKTLSDFATKIQNVSTPQELLQAAQGFQAEAASVQNTVTRLKTYTHKNCKNS
jgi:hypothetical protein